LRAVSVRTGSDTPISRYAVGAFAAVLALLVWSAPAHAESRTVRVGVYENEPKIFTSAADEGEPAGIFVDLLEAVAEQEDWTLVWVHGTWQEGLDALVDDRIDLMPDVAFSSERDEVFDFHNIPVVESWSHVYARAGVRAERISQLDGRRVAVLGGSIQQTEFARMVEGFGYDVEIVTAESFDQAFQMVSDGQADAAIANYLFGDYFYEDYGLVKTPIVFNPAAIFYATAEGRNADLLRAIDQRLGVWIGDPASPYWDALGRYTTQEEPFSMPRWVTMTLVIAATLLVSAAAGIVILRKQVRERTRYLAHAHEAARDAEATLGYALEAAQEGVFDWDPRTGKETWSVRNYAMLGFEPNEFPISERAWEALIHPEDRDRVVEAEHDGMHSEDHSFQVEYRLRHKADGWRWIVSRGKVVAFDEEGRPARVIGTNTDVTEGKRAAEELERHREHLQELVEARTAELVETNRELEEATEAKSRFLTSMSHELRTPLNSIIGFSGVLADGMAGPLSEEQERQVSMINASGKHLLLLVNDVLDLAKVEAGAMEIRVEPVDVAELFEQVVEVVRPLAEAKGLALSADIADGPVDMRTDPDKLRQILINIVGNAIKYTDEGAVTVRLHAEAAGSADFVVSDTGRGIAASEVPHVFETFRRAARTTGSHGGGTGLGLAISADLARLLGGEILVESTEGEGSTFTLRVPLVCDPAA
jgi:signal transduction histidine kinase/ABC-type amino acid transport substrate-binding protein